MTRIGAVSVLALLLAVSVTRPAEAQNEARAEAAFQRGRSLLADRKYHEACESFEESQREDPASGTLLALAYCQELSGRLASAWTNYRAAAELAQREGQNERRDAALEQSKTLADRVSVLTLRVPRDIAATPGLRITLDGVELARTSFGTPIPVNGGTYRIEAVLGDMSWATTVTIQTERDKKSLVVELVVPSHSAPSVAATPTQHAAQSAPKATHDDGSANTLASVTLGLAIGSVACLGIGLGFGISANSKNLESNRDGHCDETGCDARGTELRNEAFTAAHISNGFFLAGGALALGSAGLYLGTKLGSDESSARVDAHVSPVGAHVVLTEAF